uniref:Putative ionotropic glutamate receptor kainate-like 9 n=1 Tax=Hirudo verbana TaxID=311461 RepID=A0A2S1WLZ8_9ANNE|nr:putative ionotropic glutamate receptor kainate-like 9 [Hirudo verbana]
MRPPVLKAVKDVVNYYRWKKIYYVYDHSEGLANIELLTSIKPSPYSTLPTLTTPTRQHLVTALEIHPIRIVTPSKCHVVLRNMDARQLEGDKHVILDVTDDNILQLIFRQFQNVGMNRLNYHYLVAGLSISQMDLSDFKYGGANITGFRLVNGNVSFSLENGLLADSMSVLSRGMIKYVEGDGSAASLNKRLRFSNHDKRRSQCFESPSKAYRGMPFNARESLNIANSMRGVTFTGYTGQVSFDRYGVRKNFKLDLMEMVVDNELEKIGEWDSNKGLQITKKVDLSATSPVLKTNKTRIVTTIESKPYIMIKKQPDDPSVLLEGNDRFEGFAADLADKVADLVGFEYRIELVKDMKYGERMSDGTWNGMVGELTRKEADLAIAPLTITSIRERVIDFSKPFMSLGISIMIKKPEKQKPGVFSFMEPLSHSIWYCIVISYLGVSLVLFLVSRFSPNEWQIEEASYEGRLTFTNDFTLLNSLWFSLGAFMRRGCDVCPRSLSGRIVGSAWWFFTLIIISSYTANLAAFLTVERMLTPINGADDLAKQKEILYGTVDSGSTKEFFKTSKIPTYEKMWLFMNSEPSVFAKTTDEGVQKVRNSKGKYAFLMESTMNDYYNQRKPCNTMKVGGNLDSKGYGIGTYIGSDLRDKINVAVLQLLEQEKLQKLQKKWWYDKGQCIIETDSKSGSKQSSLSLSNVAGIFYILIGGLGLSLVVASLEFLCKSHRDLKQKKFYVTASMSSAVSGNFDKSPYQTHIPSSAVGFRPLMVSSSSETYKPLSSHTLV